MKRNRTGAPRLRFAVIGANHGHIHGMVHAAEQGGGELVSYFASEPELADEFARRHPSAARARDERELLEDPSIQLVLSAAIPDERAPLGVRVMRHGKDYMVDKPGAVSLAQLAEFDQFLFFTGSARAEVVASQVRNAAHPGRPTFEDVGDAMLRGDGGTGYVRVDWLTPAGLPTWGDTRLTVLGTVGYIKVRKNVDIGGRDGANHLIVADTDGVRRVDCGGGELPYGGQLVDDVLHRTATAMPQAHCFLATELALRAQAQARRA